MPAGIEATALHPAQPAQGELYIQVFIPGVSAPAADGGVDDWNEVVSHPA